MELRTERLLLRPQREDDVAAIIAGLNDYEVTRYLTVVPFPYTEADAREWVERQKPAVPGEAHFAIELPGEGMIGGVGIAAELGYWLNRSYHGRGYMTEASAAVLDWHFAALPDDLVHSGAHVGNTASLNVQRKLGFIDTGAPSMRLVRSQNRDIEHVETTLIRADYAAARRRLRAN
jgi:RimJ/RimL family protein N-acetyltransferase